MYGANTDKYVDWLRFANKPSSWNHNMLTLRFNQEGELLVYVSGKCFWSKEFGTEAGCGVWFNFNNELNISAPIKGEPSSNNAEIQAASMAIRQTHRIGITKIKISTNSDFLYSCATNWIHHWKQNGWLTAYGQLVQNLESLLELDSLVSVMDKVEWEYIKVYAEIGGGEEVDALARNGATLGRNKRLIIIDN